MKRAILISVFMAGAIVLFCVYVQFTYRRHFDVPVTGIKSSTDSAVVARGKYLVTGPAHCWTCHTPDAIERLQLGPSDGLRGGLKINLPLGTFYTPNITSDNETGIGKLTDEQLAATIRYSVKYNDEALLPFMTYNAMTDEDITAVISYLRSTAAVRNKVPGPEVNMLGKIAYRFLLKSAMPDITPPASIKRDTSALYGKYLANAVANCRGCHTNRSKFTGAFIGGLFAGGYEMENGTTIFTTPNLTPHETGVTYRWSARAFVNRFRTGAAYKDSPMPWKSFEKMTDDDLKAIFYYLKSLPPTENKVKIITPKS